MAQDGETHADLFAEEITSEARETAGRGTVVYAESDVETLENEQDGRMKTVLVNRDLVPDAAELLVDVVTYPPDVGVATHYHEDTDHFFYVLEGSGVLEVEGDEVPLEAGDVAWVGEGDVHRLFTGPDERLRVLEYFSNNDHTMTKVEGEDYTWATDEGTD